MTNMYKQLEQLITLTSNDLNLVSRRFGQRTDLTSEQLEMLRILYNYKKRISLTYYKKENFRLHSLDCQTS